MTKKRIAFMKDLFSFYGLEPERLHLEWISASEGPKFAEVITEFVDRIKDLGPSHLNQQWPRSQGLSLSK
jgi:F420-non-reducing hydrogenase iron-sulfur subunit